MIRTRLSRGRFSMDTSKEYIDMCMKATEVQKTREFMTGDFNSNAQGVGVLVNQKQVEITLDTWLPRQDQLQDMLYVLPTDPRYHGEGVFNISFVACPNVICKELAEFSEADCEMGLKTMEQLWLAFVMKEKYDKVWNGKDWELSKEKKKDED